MTLQDLASGSEVDTQVETAVGGGAFNSRKPISDLPLVAKKPVGLLNCLVANGDSGLDVCSSNTQTRGNDSAQTALHKSNDL